MIFSAYRKDDFADPDGFVLQLGMILERYPDAVIAEVSSPLTGIQRRHKGRPPDIAAIVEACDEEVARAARIRRFSEMRTAPREPRPIDPSARANLLVKFDSPGYAQMQEWAQQNPDSSRFDPRGVWVPLHVYTERDESAKPVAGLKRYTADELKALYAKPMPGEAAE